MGFLYMAHSGVRYLVLLAGIAALVLSLLKGSDGNAKKAMGAFVGLLDVQILLGLLLLMQVPFYGQLIGHLACMFGAMFAAHGFSVAARKRPEGSGGTLRAAGVLVTLALVVLGIMAIGRPIFGSSM